MLIGGAFRSNFFNSESLSISNYYWSAAILLCGTLVGDSMSASLLNKVISPIL